MSATSSGSDIAPSATASSETALQNSSSVVPVMSETVGVAEKDPSDVAMGAIQTTLSISGWTIGVLGLIIALIAIFGWSSIFDSAKKTAERIANEKWNDYIKSDEYAAIVNASIDSSVERRWQEWVISHGVTDTSEPDDGTEAFPNEGEA